jgi:hypothetical protein
MLRFLFSWDTLGSWCATIIAVLLAVGIYRFTARRFQTQLARLRQGTSRHPIVTLLLILYGMIGGIMLGMMFLSAINAAVAIAIAIPMLVLPFLAGCCAGWWQTRSDGAGSGVRPIVEQGMLAGFLVTVLAAALALIMIVWFAWSSPTGEPPLSWDALRVVGAFFLAAAYLALGMSFGVGGALLSVNVHRWRRPNGPTTPVGVS